MNVIEQSVSQGVRFVTRVGQLSTEDLYRLPLLVKEGAVETRGGTPICLDEIAIGLSTELEKSGNVSFVKTKTKANELLKLKLDIVKHIIDVKLAEQSARETALAKKEELQKLLVLEDEDKDAALKAMTPEERRKRIEELSK